MAKTKTYRRWSTEELSYLYEKYDEITAELIAQHLDRTLDSVWSKAEQEGLRKKSKRRDKDGPWLCPKCKKTKLKEEFNSEFCKECE